MKHLAKTVRGARKCIFDVRVLYALTGFIISIVAHELVHVVMHFGNIQSIHFLPNLSTVVTIFVDSPDGYNMNAEEMAAYAVSTVIQLITILDVFAIHDSRDRNPVGKLIFGKRDELSEDDNRLLLQLISK